MSTTIRARRKGGDVDLTIELETGEFRQVTVVDGGLLPTNIDGVAIPASLRDQLLEQDGWERFRQPDQTKKADTASAETSPATGGKKEA